MAPLIRSYCHNSLCTGFLRNSRICAMPLQIVLDATISLGESNNLLAILLHQSPNSQVASNVPHAASKSK
ncbi:hypothetical protein PVAP13_1KG336300 [Panicum virgatum]|uniref:Uncharacterized protein n=1 Tax=Panicum virgatum TaxID=38727 RepID=A0A8T0XUN0_PANVG|nr:hypothetical protein PVAP13_1KG336300 [Panicum virgatum]